MATETNDTGRLSRGSSHHRRIRGGPRIDSLDDADQPVGLPAGPAGNLGAARIDRSRIDMVNADAARAIDNLIGSVGADLNSVRREARRFPGVQPEPEVGHLNFALALLSLVGCEAAGFLLTGGSKEQSGSCHPTDSGTYIIQFIEGFFPNTSAFRRVSKILADDLRHELVHGFGSRNPERPFDLDVLVAEPPVPSVEPGHEAKSLRINSLRLADDTSAARSGNRCSSTPNWPPCDTAVHRQDPEARWARAETRTARPAS